MGKPFGTPLESLQDSPEPLAGRKGLASKNPGRSRPFGPRSSALGPSSVVIMTSPKIDGSIYAGSANDAKLDHVAVIATVIHHRSHRLSACVKTSAGHFNTVVDSDIVLITTLLLRLTTRSVISRAVELTR